MRTLTIDDVAVARLATEHLIGLGHRRIAHIGGDIEFDLDFHLPTNRRIGYEGALRDAGIEVDPRLFAPADFTIKGGYHAAKQLLGVPHDRPTAIFAASDEMAIGSILAARDLGLIVPRDVSIIGIDDHDLSDFFGLSTTALVGTSALAGGIAGAVVDAHVGGASFGTGLLLGSIGTAGLALYGLRDRVMTAALASRTNALSGEGEPVRT